MIDTLFNKYMTESKEFKGNMKQLLNKGKTGNFMVGDGNQLKITKVADMMVFEYPSNATDITMQLIDAADAKGYKFQQIGMRSKGNMKFIVEL